MNAHAEKFVRSIKESSLDRMIWFGEGSLRKGIPDPVPTGRKVFARGYNPGSDKPRSQSTAG